MEKTEYVDRGGVRHFDSLMGELGWVPIGDSREADWKRVDQTYQLGCAVVYIQIKSANLSKMLDRRYQPPKIYERWHWKIIRKGKQLPINFYKEKDCFLSCVGLNVHEEIYAKTRLMIHGNPVKKFIELEKPEMGLIPGGKVVGYFENRSAGTRSIGRYKNAKKPSKWDKYFGRENIEKLLIEEFERQTKERQEI